MFVSSSVKLGIYPQRSIFRSYLPLQHPIDLQGYCWWGGLAFGSVAVRYLFITQTTSQKVQMLLFFSPIVKHQPLPRKSCAGATDFTFALVSRLSLLTDSSYLWRDCSWREPEAPRTQAQERRISEQRHPPTPSKDKKVWQKIGLLLHTRLAKQFSYYSLYPTPSHWRDIYFSNDFGLSSQYATDSGKKCRFIRPEAHWLHSCRQGDLKRSRQSAGKKERAALDISEWGREDRGALLMGRKSKPIMHLIILVCGLFMHLISSHPYSFLAAAAAPTHVDQLAVAKLNGFFFFRGKLILKKKKREKMLNMLNWSPSCLEMLMHKWTCHWRSKCLHDCWEYVSKSNFDVKTRNQWLSAGFNLWF